ncbi:MAG: adenylosuccinate synthase [Bacteroidales bacterium]|jgi:adenylosuccinate synthase|nr:adenylosuccinate synthase [Bacteroidales bacterium]MDD2688327.1 adenylosuccinate synthase [Bacteroidales bacterium]MDD3330596.1 adenylosuccinate synthase [Bacteroidales bacterium]MDD3690698.1 adenylosuccinate synthase [Bacteroidales bacterium]MDD4043967.1 adenylosuccinate synthase [Bacteroidales bacterium]
MKIDILLGLQWGDEGKGKAIDVLTPTYDIVARFQGGTNAGHTLEFDNHKFILHTIPSGIFRENTQNVIGNGVIIDPYILINKEINAISSYADVKKNLYISLKSNLILPTHRLLDHAQEAALGNKKIGSTLKGIGPTYADKTSRKGIRLGEAFITGFAEKYAELKQAHLRQIEHMDFDYSQVRIEGLAFETFEDAWMQALEALKDYQLVSTEYLINNALTNGKSVLAEGAQGTLLDVDFGTYPYVTSSNTIAAGACSGLGVGPSKIGKVYGLFKAYCTRVGAGVFPTELQDEMGMYLQNKGKEFGSTTQRPRRCGWIDLPLLKYACMVNGVTDLIITKIDVLNELDTIQVCTDYEINGKITQEIPYNLDHTIKPVYKSMAGWKQELNKTKIPVQLAEYIKYIADYLNQKIFLVSIGPDRKDNIIF